MALTYREEQELRRVLRERGNSESEITSLVIAAATDSAIIGTILGGSITGAVVGDFLNGFDLFD